MEMACEDTNLFTETDMGFETEPSEPSRGPLGTGGPGMIDDGMHRVRVKIKKFFCLVVTGTMT
jgi:hypothetical protein